MTESVEMRADGTRAPRRPQPTDETRTGTSISSESRPGKTRHEEMHTTAFPIYFPYPAGSFNTKARPFRCRAHTALARPHVAQQRCTTSASVTGAWPQHLYGVGLLVAEEQYRVRQKTTCRPRWRHRCARYLVCRAARADA
jgi:hypothetical protein